MSKLLFIVHGMGSNPPGWSDGVRDKLDEVASRYSAFRDGTARFSQRIRIVEIRYDGIFEEIVQDWKADADKLAEFSARSQRPMPKVVAWLKKPLAADVKGFFWSTAIDPLLYRGFSLVRDRVRAAVTAQIVSGLTKNMVGGTIDASVLAHSLGTIVMHDSLHELGAAPFQGNESFTAKRWKFSNVFMLADVCCLGPKVLQDIDYASSIVRPVGDHDADDCYCQFFLNVSHRWDPFVLAGPFTPSTWGDGYMPVGPLEHFKHANVHGFSHYLDHPSVHIPIINGTLGTPAITEKEMQDAIARYPSLGSGECSSQITKLKAKAKEMKKAGNDLEQLVIETSEFYALAKAAAEECRSLAGGE
jgi:hypothetical protein